MLMSTAVKLDFPERAEVTETLCVQQTTYSSFTNLEMYFLFECQLDYSGKNVSLGQGSSTRLNLRATSGVVGQIKGNQTLVK